VERYIGQRNLIGPARSRELTPAWSAEPDTGQSLVDYLVTIWRRKYFVLAAAIAGALCGYVVGLPQTPVYKAATTLEIQEPNDAFLNIKDLEPTTRSPLAGSYLETQIRILQGSALRKRVIEELVKQAPYKPSQDRLSETLIKLNLPPIKNPVTHVEAVSMANSTLSLRQLGHSQVLQIQTESTDPQVAAAFANGLVKEYIDYILETRSYSSQQTSDWLNEQIDELRTRLADSELQLQNYLRDSSLIVTGDTNLVEDRLKRIQQDLAQAQAERTNRESRQLTAKEANPESLPEVLDDANVRAFQSQLAGLQGRMLELSAIYASEHYRVRQVQDQIKALEDKIQQEKAKLQERIKNDFVTAKRREDMLEGIYEGQLRALVEQKPRLIQYNLLKREVESNRALYEAMQQKVKTLKIAGGLRATNVRVLDVAQPGSQPDTPNVRRNVLTGLATASFLGVLLALFRENATRKVMSAPGEVRQKWNVPELGVILSSAQQRRLLLPAIGESTTGNGMELVAWQHRASLQAESVRSVVASILARRIEKSVMVVTSPGAREGKTAVTANLAAALADTNRRVLVIDADLHNPSLHKVFDVSNTWGLSDLASANNAVETYPLDALVRPTSLDSLYLLPSGPGTSSTIKLLYSNRLSELLKRFRKEFDVVLIDTPPMMEIADARVLARQADGVILVFRAGATSVDLAHASLERLSQDGTPIIGTILNDWTPRVQNFPYGNRYGVASWARPGA